MEKENSSITPINEELNVVTYEVENIRNLIYTIRGKQVMLDSNVDIVQKYTDMSRLFNAVVAPTRLNDYKHIKYKACISFK